MKDDIKLTWKDVVKEALLKTGKSGHLEDINSQIEGHWKTETNPTWRDTVRRTLQQYSIFYQEEKGSGVWHLREEKPFEEFDPKKNPTPLHEDVQGMLLELGRIYDYETSAAVNDAKKNFMNRPLEEVATMKEFPEQFSYPKIVDIVSRIDVMWFSKNTDFPVPVYAFEIEHTTDVTKGLARLHDLYNSGQRTKLYIILPSEKIPKFDKEIGRSLFTDIKKICKVKTYEPLIALYNLAIEHDLRKMDFFED
ncbi:MAG: hypothetical protein O8C61_04205 [Candidatus Methanoperedens sp.]|nr:hypothetical protein [Candidatus Methanoperedens sp.]